VSDQNIFWLICAGVVTLAVLLLWLRDRFRDFRHVPEAERKLSERRNAAGAAAFGCLIWAAGFVFRAVETAAAVPRVVYVLIAIALIWISWRSYRDYRRIGETK